jgi:hypothetical protein
VVVASVDGRDHVVVIDFNQFKTGSTGVVVV